MTYICERCIHKYPNGGCIVPCTIGYTGKCYYFYEKPKHTPEQTNDEWRKTCSAEEFAEWISNLAYACMRCGMSNGEAYCHTGYCIQDKEDAEKWLQEEHYESV